MPKALDDAIAGRPRSNAHPTSPLNPASPTRYFLNGKKISQPCRHDFVYALIAFGEHKMVRP